MKRRDFVTNGLLFPAAAAAMQGGQAPAGPAGGRLKLRDKFFGCIAGVYVGSALKGPCEGWPWRDCEAKYGTIDHLMPYQDYNNGWNREPGTTEDGVERQKYMIAAIMEKKDRITAEDVRAMWVRYMKPEAAGMISEPTESIFLAFAKSTMPAADIGKYFDYGGTVGMARACHPLGLINAGDVEAAVDDIFEVSQLYYLTGSRAAQWAAITGTAIASATKPGATIDSVIADVLKGHPRISAKSTIPGNDYTHNAVTAEIERGLELTKKCQDFREMRVAFDPVYNGKGMPYNNAYANEVVTKGICVFNMVKANTKEAMLAGVNMGRDTDCLAAVAAGISGALTGAGTIPQDWIKQVDYATTKIPVTCARWTIREAADGLYDAYRARLAKMRTYTTQMEQA